MKTSLFSFVLICIIALTSSCREDVDASAIEVYKGPMKSTLNIHLIQSDSAIVRSEIKAPKQLEFANGNLEFPDGIEIQIFEKDGQLSTTIRADRGYFLKAESTFKGEGDVQVHNLIKDQKLQSEELFWDQIKKIIYTEKFVRIQNGGAFSYGSGFEADETFTNYSLKDPRDGQIEISED
ncbi:LPS export ABC transporter periplasmic protein LptC [Algoriphagus sp. D3-2-R+10]|uniref:LPS export ABC transporter periplasmic protein LptC n=1 Tax=Algoriphagus aurantiacus TaxID=3103948 RepID=UPI002B3A43C9|nr:LPS export ABC transporter periplasmic protein LptC [Algoriphagus sp. D3-2-R+10]MEB2773785.1 LPS export ABC transporter periplasmic protein LptC [Algoriphagus sp. D3-2-R+10]